MKDKKTTPDLKNGDNEPQDDTTVNKQHKDTLSKEISVVKKDSSKQDDQIPNAEMVDSENAEKVDYEFDSAKLIADQSAAMMLQDMRGFLQGTEQILTMAIAKCLAKITETDAAEGSKALAQCEDLLMKLPKFASEIGDAASDVSKKFE